MIQTENTQTHIALAGFLTTAVAYGPARMGFGLFLPQFRDTFRFTIEQAGLTASSAYGAFLLALLLSGFLTSRFGPRGPLAFGGLSAALGLSLVSLAPNVPVLAAGIILAASSAGFSWVPYNNAAKREVPDDLQGRVLSIVSTGTTFGVAAAAILAWIIVLFGYGWRLTWALFACCGLAAAGINAYALKRLRPEQSGRFAAPPPGKVWIMKDLLTRKALPLFGIALSFGATASVYLSFSVDLVVQSGGLPGISAEAVGPVLFACYGLAGIVGMFTGDLEKKLGIAILLRIIFLLSTFSLALLGFATGDWFAIIISSSLQGICVMTVSAILAFWSLRVFPFSPAVSFTAVLLFLAAGNMVGPVLASLLASRFGMETAFLACAAFSLLTALLIRGSSR